MSVEIHGQRELQARLVALQSQGKPIMGLVGLTAIREQKRLVPRKTGNLARTIHLGRVTDRVAETEATAKYAASVEFDTKPHIIRPRKARALRFPAAGSPTTLSGRVKKGGAFAFAQIVHHPGTKGQPYMVPGARRALDLAGLKDLVVKAWNRAA